MSNAAADKAFKGKLEVLLGMRKNAEGDRAVRLREIAGLISRFPSMAASIDPAIIKPIIDKAVDDALEGYTPPGWDPILERIEQAEQDAEQAKQDALNALAQANAAIANIDEQVGLLYQDMLALEAQAGLIDGRVTEVRNDLDDAKDQIALDLQANLEAANAYTLSGFTSYNTTIQGQFESVAGQIEQLTAALTSTNLVGNGLFALGATGWTFANATLLARADLTGLGASCPQPNLVELAAATAASIQTDLNTFSVTANDRVQFRFMAASMAIRTLTITLTWEDAAGNPIGTPSVETLTVSPANTWKVYGKQVDPPDNAVGATLTISKASGGSAALITAIECSTVNVALEARVTEIEGAYVSETEVTAIVTSAVQARYEDAVALIADERIAWTNADSAIGDRIGLVESDMAAAEALISSQATTIANLTSATAQLDEAVTSTFGAAELISDPVFAYGLARWLPGSLVNSSDIILKNTDPAVSWVFQTMPAKRGLRIRSGQTGQAQSLPMAVKPGDVLDFSFDYARASNGVIPGIEYRFRNASDAFVAATEPVGLPQKVRGTGSASWQSVQQTGILVPAGAVTAEVRILNDGNGVNACYVTNISLRRRQALDFLTQASVKTLTQAYADLDGAFADYKLELSAIFNNPTTGFSALATQIDNRYTKAQTDLAISASKTEYRSALYKMAGGIISDPYLASSGWIRWSGQGNFTWTDNEVYDSGRTGRFVVTAAQADGLRIAASPDTIWPGQKNADAYVIEVEYDFVSGNLDGAGVMIWWTSSTGNYATRKTLRDMTSGVYSFGKKIARGVFKKPANFAGTFQSHDLYVFANYGSFGVAMAAKTIKFSRVSIRVATAEEAGSGEVMAAVEATLTENYFTKTDTNKAIANFDMDLHATLGKGWASVKRSASAIAGLDGNVARFRDVVTADGGKVAAGIEAVAFDSVGGASGSLLKLIGDNIIAEGTISTRSLIVGLGGNLLMDPSFDDGFATNWIEAGSLPAAQRSIGLRGAGESYAHPGWPTLMIRQTSGYLDGSRYGQIYQRPSANGAGARYPGVPVTGGKWYIASAYLATLRCEGQLYIYWYDAAGNQLSAASTARRQYLVPSGGAAKPDSWVRPSLKAQAPADAAYASISFVKRDTLSGQSDSWMFIWKPQLELVQEQAEEPKPWSPGGTTYINGGRLFAKSIQTKHLDTVDLGVSGLAIFNGRLQSLNYNPNTWDGWAINNDGGMRMPRAVIKSANIDNLQVDTGHIKDLAVNTLKINNRAVTAPRVALRNTTLSLTGSWVDLLSLTFTPFDLASDIMVLMSWYGGSRTRSVVEGSSGTETYFSRCDVRLLWRGSVVTTYNGMSGEPGNRTEMDILTAPGTTSGTLKLQARNGESSIPPCNISGINLFALELKR